MANAEVRYSFDLAWKDYLHPLDLQNIINMIESNEEGNVQWLVEQDDGPCK